MTDKVAANKIAKYFKDNGHHLEPYNPQSMLIFFTIVDIYPDAYTQKIPAIKLWRALTNCGLKESKDFIEDLEENGYMPLRWEHESRPNKTYKYKKIVKDCRAVVPELFAKLKLAHAKALLEGEPQPVMRHWWAVSHIIHDFREVEEHNG